MNISNSYKNPIKKFRKFGFYKLDGFYPLGQKSFIYQKFYLETDICNVISDRVMYYIFLIGKNKFDLSWVMTTLT